MLFIDFETTSYISVKDVGAQAYARHPSTKILCMAYAFDDEEVDVWVPHFQQLPNRIKEHIESGGKVSAWNVAFERSVIENNDFPKVADDQWVCTMAKATRLGLPASLKETAKAVGDVEKDEDGARAMRMLSDLKKLESMDEDKRRELFEITLSYCKRDVEAERSISNSIPPLDEVEKRVWQLDQKINFAGIPIDTELCNNIVDSLKDYMDKASSRVPEITGGEVEKPTQVQRIKKFCESRGVAVDNLQAATLDKLLMSNLPQDVRELLEIRQKTSLASTAKYAKMIEMSPTGRAYGTLKYHGAATGRWSGKGLQPQNLPRPSSQEAVESYVEMFLDGRSKDIDDVYTAAKSCLRAAISAPKGKTLVVLDYSGIEARVLAWYAGDQSTIEKMEAGVDLYKDMASDIYQCPISEVTPEQRHVGKAAILGLGYQMGSKKFHEELQKIDESYTLQDAQDIVTAYRNKYAKNVALWYELQRTAQSVTGKWDTYGPWRRYELPSGRHLHYFNMHMSDSGLKYKKVVTSRGGKMYNTSIYAGKFCENIVQAIARDVLASAMLRIDEAGYKIISTVHDEVVIEVDEDKADETFSEVKDIMTTERNWAVGLPLNVEGYISKRFKK